MSQATITLESSGWDAFLRTLSSNMKPTKLLRAAFNTVGFKDVVQHFKDETGPNAKWPLRKPSTDARYDKIANGKRRDGSPYAVPKGLPRNAFKSSNNLLQLTGSLRGTILPGNVEDVNETTIMFFSNTPYSRSHDEGNPKNNLPARSFMWLSDQAQETMAEVVLDQWTKGA